MEHQKQRAKSAQVLQSGTYEVDLAIGELRQNGRRIPLQEQPFKVLLKLLAHPGAPVTREELQTALWGAHPLVDTELGLNTAVRKLRTAFRDPADNPRFIETLPKQGYRFIAPVREKDVEPLRVTLAVPESIAPDSAGTPEVSRHGEALAEVVAIGADREISMSRSSAARPSSHGRLIWLCACLLLLCIAGLLTAASSMMSQSTSIGRAGVPGIVKFYAANGQPGRFDEGIGGYDLRSREDRAFAFDYDHSGKLDHLVFYRPGTSSIWILGYSHGHFRPVFEGGGIGNYGLIFGGADRVFAFDYDHSGKLDHLVFYRQGVGVLRILKNEGRGVFTPVYQAASDDRLSSSADGPPAFADQVIPFDYDHSGKPDHLLFYRSGQGIVGTWTNIDGRLSPVEAHDVNGLGHPLPALASEQAFAFDYDHAGKLDYLVVYRPGEGTAVILRNLGGAFAPVYEGQGLGGQDLKSPNDRMLAFDYDGSGKLDHLLLYRPGAGVVSILENAHGTFRPMYQGQGFAGYDFMSINDRALAFDFVGSGKLDHLAFYRPGSGIARIVRLR
jgi:DNA-binding winged helix-turn-helix (wHTH) protein